MRNGEQETRRPTGCCRIAALEVSLCSQERRIRNNAVQRFAYCVKRAALSVWRIALGVLRAASSVYHLADRRVAFYFCNPNVSDLARFDLLLYDNIFVTPCLAA